MGHPDRIGSYWRGKDHDVRLAVGYSKLVILAGRRAVREIWHRFV